MSDCLFCKVVNKKIPATFELDEKELVAIRDINPQAPVHLLIIPREHVATIGDLTSAQAAITGKLVDAARRMAEKLKLAAYRLVFNNGSEAGQSVFHIHLHLLAGRPMRWPPG